MDLFQMDFFHPETIIQQGGIALLLIIIFIETGLFFGFFLPGDSLLFIAGILADSHYIQVDIWLLIILIVLAAVAGTTVGYGFGYWAKQYLEQRKENIFYKRKYLEATEEFYLRHGMSAFIIGRFLPVIRTFVPILAGIVRIDFTKFLFFNILGATIWASSLILSGYWLGNTFPAVLKNLELIIISMIFLSAMPIIHSWWKFRKNYKKEMR